MNTPLLKSFELSFITIKKHFSLRFTQLHFSLVYFQVFSRPPSSLYFTECSVTTLSLAKVKVKVILRPTVSRPVCLGVKHPSGTRDQFFFLLEILFRQLQVRYFVAPSLTRGRICNLLTRDKFFLFSL
jgi:hypothetical protein